MPEQEQPIEKQRKAAKMVLAHQLISELYKELPKSSVRNNVQDAGLSLSNGICLQSAYDYMLLDLDTFDRLRDSDVLDSDEFNELVDLSVQTMYPDEAAD